MVKQIFIILSLIVAPLIALTSCKQRESNQYEPITRSIQEIKESGELRILTLYSSTSYFIYKGSEMGYEYEMARSFAHSLGLKPTVIAAKNIGQLYELLQNGAGDLVAYPMPLSMGKYETQLLFCGNENITTQVLVQNSIPKEGIIQDVTELVGKVIYVEEDTKYHHRLENLNAELGGGIQIHTIAHDSVTTEDLIGMVASGGIPFTLSDDNLARINQTYHKNLDISLQISFQQRSAWIVNSNAQELAKIVNEWSKSAHNSNQRTAIMKRYFESSKLPDAPLSFVAKEKGVLSPYDELLKLNAKELKWDWRLLAAISYEESQFDPEATSWAGAVGLMQLMPATARNFGLADSLFFDPAANLIAGTAYIASLQKSFSRISDPDEQLKFILGAFHAGLGHIFDAVALARKLGYNPNVWDGNVAVCIQLKINPQYYNDPIVKLGYFPGYTTTDHVTNILARYHVFKQIAK